MYDNIQQAPKVVLVWFVWAKDNSAGWASLRFNSPHNIPAVWLVDSTHFEEASYSCVTCYYVM